MIKGFKLTSTKINFRCIFLFFHHKFCHGLL
jgi:hypothetical protein